MSRVIRVDAEVRARLDAIQAELQAAAPGRVRGAGTSMSAAVAEALRRSAFCSAGHPPHDPALGCGPCADEALALG